MSEYQLHGQEGGYVKLDSFNQEDEIIDEPKEEETVLVCPECGSNNIDELETKKGIVFECDDCGEVYRHEEEEQPTSDELGEEEEDDDEDEPTLVCPGCNSM